MQIGDVLKSDCVICTEETPLNTVFELMLQNKCDCIAVVESFAHKVPLGLITERDICMQLVKKHRDPRWLTAANVMNANVSKFENTKNVEACLSLMQKQDSDYSFVIDKKGMFCGTVKRDDLKTLKSNGKNALVPDSQQNTFNRYKAGARKRSYVRSSDTIF